MKKRGVILCYFAILIFVSGCVSIFGGAYGVAQEERSNTAIYTDERIKLTIDKRIMDEVINVFDYATFCYNGDVYLIGEYETVEQKEKVIGIAHSLKGVKSVTTYLLPKRQIDKCGRMDLAAISIRVQAFSSRTMLSTRRTSTSRWFNATLFFWELWERQSEADKAVAHAQGLDGVIGVTSYLKAMR